MKRIMLTIGLLTSLSQAWTQSTCRGHWCDGSKTSGKETIVPSEQVREREFPKIEERPKAEPKEPSKPVEPKSNTQK